MGTRLHEAKRRKRGETGCGAGTKGREALRALGAKPLSRKGGVAGSPRSKGSLQPLLASSARGRLSPPIWVLSKSGETGPRRGCYLEIIVYFF